MPIPTDYRLVMDRLREALPEIREIMTDPPVMLTASSGYIRTTIHWKGNRITTGTSLFRLDIEGRSAKATSPIEDCETSAVGRALGFAGYYGPESFASHEEILKAEEYAEYDSITTVDYNALQDSINFLRENSEVVQSLYPGITPRLFREHSPTDQTKIIETVRRYLAGREPETEDDSQPPDLADNPVLLAHSVVRDQLQKLFLEREVEHDGRRIADLTADEADELFSPWQAARKRTKEAICKYCSRTIYWCKLPDSTQSMPMNSDGTLHHSTCAGVDPKTGKFVAPPKPPLYAEPTFDTLEPIEPSNVICPALFKNQDKDDFPINSLATLIEHALTTDDLTAATDQDVAELDQRMMHLYPDAPLPALSWWIEYLLSGVLNQHRVDVLLWWLATRPAHDARRALDVLVWDTAATYGPLKALPAAAKPAAWPKRALILWAKTLLASDDGARSGFKNRADVFLALDTAWTQHGGARYYHIDNADRDTIYRGLSSDRRVTSYVLETIDATTNTD